MNVENAYNLWSKQYDTNQNMTRDLDKVATEVTLSKYEFKKVIELGCGTGKNTIFLLEKASQIFGLDFSAEMLKKARDKISSEQVEFRKADITTDWRIDNLVVDLITCSLTLEHIEDLNFIFNQAFSKLKRNGLFFVCELHPYKQYQGSKARFENQEKTLELKVFTHHISDYLDSSKNAGFKLLELQEWFDKDLEENKIPRLVSFVFQK